MSDRGVRQIWAEWLNEWNWEWFVTLTFKERGRDCEGRETLEKMDKGAK